MRFWSVNARIVMKGAGHRIFSPGIISTMVACGHDRTVWDHFHNDCGSDRTVMKYDRPVWLSQWSSRSDRNRPDPEGSRVLMKCLFYLSTFFSSYLGVQYLAAKNPYPINPPILLQIISVTSKTPMPNANWRSSMVMEAMIGMSHLRLPCL